MLLTSNNPQLISKYTVDNKNIKHLERILKRRIRENRKISLCHFKNGTYYFPLGAKQYFDNDEFLYHSDILDISFKKEVVLKDFQQEAINHIVWNGCGLIDAKTGAGKSFILMGLVNIFKRSTLIIVPTVKLLLEMQEKFKTFMGYEPGVFYGKEKNIKPVTITTTKSYCENNLGLFDIMIIDEGDTGVSSRFIEKICTSDCNHLIGLTGTPSRIELDKNDLELFYGPYIKIGDYQERPTESIQYIYHWDRDAEIDVTFPSFAETRTAIAEYLPRSEKIIKKILEIKQKYNIILVLTDRVDECETLGKMIEGAKVIHGNTKIKDDLVGIDEVVKNGGIIIGTRQKMGRGVDIPAIDCVCMVGAFKFRPSVIQAIGRALRTFEGKKDIGVFIFSDSILKSQLYENKKTVEKEYGVQVERQVLD